jgi:hypothetical protein
VAITESVRLESQVGRACTPHITPTTARWPWPAHTTARDGADAVLGLVARLVVAFRYLGTSVPTLTAASHPIDFRFHDATCDIQARGPAIATDESGRIVQIRFNNWLRSTLSAPEESIRPIYDALGEFWKRLRDPKYHLTIRLKPGELFTYSNNRVLHGRESFDPNSGHRHLQGCYITHEDVVSKLRLLNRSRT